MEEVNQSYQSLSHSKWDCKYHVVFIPKKRRKVLFQQAGRSLGTIFHALARQKECQILEGHVMPDHVHMCIAIPPKFPVASVIGLLKGKSAIAVARELCGRERNFTGQSIYGHGDMQCPPSVLSWSRFANTSAAKRKRMDRENHFRFRYRDTL